MEKNKWVRVRWITVLSGLLFLAAVFLTPPVFAGDDIQMLKKQLEAMSLQMKAVQEKIETLEKTKIEKDEQISEMDQRLNKAELHTATDKISFGVELRSRGESIHYSDLRVAPASLTAGFFTDYNAANPLLGGFNKGTLSQIQNLIGTMGALGAVPNPEKYDADNDIIYTNRFRLNMKAKVNDSLNFAGRLAAYKVFGDSTGIKFNQGSLGDVTLDGTTTSLPHGDTIRLERAYFVYKKDLDQVPMAVSFGRRPSTEGPPLEYKNYSLEGGSPLSPLINWQFDGASLNFGLEDVTGIPGAGLKFCYGVGFEGDWGNSSSLSSSADVQDVHMAGLIATLYDDDLTSAVVNYAYAWDVTDGFTGLTVMPFIAYKTQNAAGDDVYNFEPNYGGYVSRVEPSTNIGDWQAATALVKTNLEEWLADIDLFLAVSWSHTDPSNISGNPFYELMGMGLLSSNGNLEQHDGYSLYAGALFPMPFGGRLGLEYNWGSKYWFNFTGAEDSLISSKLAARGQVYEAYYIQPVFGDKFFLKLGGQYYDYKYTGSGNPLGKPVEIDNATALDTLFPVVDTVWNAYASVTLRF